MHSVAAPKKNSPSNTGVLSDHKNSVPARESNFRNRHHISSIESILCEPSVASADENKNTDQQIEKTERLNLKHHFGKMPVFNRPTLLLQPKLAVNAPGDLFEQEADEVSEKVMRVPMTPMAISHATIQRKCAHCEEEEKKSTQRMIIQRKCAHCEEEEKKQIQKKSSGGAANLNFSAVNQTLNSPGLPMDGIIRSFMEQRLGYDFSRVRIHNDSLAQQSAKDMNALAYTHGSNIVFGNGQYQPRSNTGKKLIAHELTHVIQQNRGSGLISRQSNELNDPWLQIQGYTQKTVSSIVIDRQSRRARFTTLGGETMDGMVTSLSNAFGEGEYLLEKSYGNDPERTWNIKKSDGKVFPGGLMFSVVMNNGIDFESISYTKPVDLQVVSGVLQSLINIDQRVKDIVSIANKTRVNKEDEEKIISLLTNVPIEQSGELAAKINETTVDGMSLFDKLDSVVDTEENMLLHQALSQLRLRGKNKTGAADLSKAPVLAWHDVMGFFEQSSTFSITKESDGKIRIKYLGAVSSGLLSNPDYKEIKDMNASTRLNWMAGGVVLDPDQPVIIHDYDREKFVILTAQDLISYQHAGIRKFLQDTVTIASLATPVGAETVAGKAIVITFEKVLPALVLLVEENKLNIKKWFPNWGPAILQATEIVKIGIAVYGAAQFVRGSWQVFNKLKNIRNARKLMDAKTIADSAGELDQAEKVAMQLEKQADDLLIQAEKARKDLGLTIEEGISAESAVASTTKAGAELENVAAKTTVVDDAISKGKFTDADFAKLVNKELSNPRVRPSTQPGYDIEVAIEGTDHFLARKPDGKWCLFSGTPKGCGLIPVSEDLDRIFAEITSELKLSPPKIGNQGKVDISKAVQDAKDAGFIKASGEPLGVDLAVQPHSVASDTRKALGVSGKDVQSAHNAPTAAIKNYPGYSREGALTILMPRAVHKQFDDYWKAYSIAQRQKGITQVTVDTFMGVMDKAIQQTPNLSLQTKNAMSGLMFSEFAKLGLKPDDLITLPFTNIGPKIP